MAEVKKLTVREKEIRQQLLDGEIPDSDRRWLNNRPVGKIYAREGRTSPLAQHDPWGRRRDVVIGTHELPKEIAKLTRLTSFARDGHPATRRIERGPTGAGPLAFGQVHFTLRSNV